MPDSMMTPDARLDAALTAMRETGPVDQEAVTRVAARAVLANEPRNHASACALVEDLVGALDKFNVGQHEKDQLLGALGPMKSDIVEKP